MEKRTKSLMPEGAPKLVRCYDNGGETFDRFTVSYTRANNFGLTGRTVGVGMSEYPYSPQGFGQHFDYDSPIDRPSYGHLGRKIQFSALPPDCQRVVMDDYKDLWKLKTTKKGD